MAVIGGKYAAAGHEKPFQLGIFETNYETLIHADDTVDQNEYGDHCYDYLDGSGEILGAHFVSYTDGEGAVNTPAGKLLIFNDEITVTAGDTAITTDERWCIIGWIQVSADDWQSDANGASVYYDCQPIAYPRSDDDHVPQRYYFVWFHEDATGYNSEQGDDEVLAVNLFYRLDHRE